MPEPQYLSTDPNAGQPPGAYLSTDPDAGLPHFKQSDTTPNDLTYGPGAAYGKLWDTVIEHLPAILGATGGIAGGLGGTVAGVGVGGPPAAISGAALGGAAGEAFKELINRARGKTAPSSSLEAAAKIATQGGTQAAAQGVGEVAGPLMTSLGERVMQSAVKPGLKTLLASVKAGAPVPPVVKTLLDEGINVTATGLERLKTLIGTTNADITSALGPKAATELPALKVAGRLNQTAKSFVTQVNPQADLQAISQVGENFLEHPAITPRGTITIADAQALKQGTYKQIGKSYGQPNASATIAAEKALARGLKEDIAAEVPDVSALNAREGKLLEALSAVGKRVALAGNRDPIGFAWVAHSPTTFLAALFDRSPAVKSLVARGLYSAAGTTAKVSPHLIRLAVTSLASGDPDAALTSSSTDPGSR